MQLELHLSYVLYWSLLKDTIKVDLFYTFLRQIGRLLQWQSRVKMAKISSMFRFFPQKKLSKSWKTRRAKN